jgi:hypothetical protein
LLERQFARQNPERIPAPESGLGAQIEAMVQQAVQDQVAEQLEKQPRSPRVRELMRQFDAPEPTYTDFKQIPPTPTTAPAKNLSAQLHRDGAGVVRWAEINGVKFKAIRNGAGVLLGMEQVEDSPVLPALDIDPKAEARKYNQGEPR